MNMLNENFILTNFHLPDHTSELSKADCCLCKIKANFEIYLKLQNLTDKSHTSMYEEIVRVLDYVGHLSVPAFKIEDELEALYAKQYKHAPNLRKKLWLDHYNYLHHPYTILKNRCYKLLEDLDNLYISIYDSKPPNWKI